MRKVIGIGETILDILFEDNQPTAAVPGGSVFNGIVSLARTGVPVSFISETGNDRVGRIILDFMRQSGIDTSGVSVFPDGKSPVSLAFLDPRGDAEYIFYKDYPRQRLDAEFPPIGADDVVVMGSYYALNPVLRDKVTDLLERARQAGAIVYYDPNFRANHSSEAIKLNATIIENLEYADLVRGSADDFFYLYGTRDADKVYRDHVKFYCPTFICTAGGGRVALRTPTLCKDYDVPALQAVSTVGAGDNFNAGLVYGLLAEGISRHDLLHAMTPERWDRLVAWGMAFSADVCLQLGNSVSPAFAAAHRYTPPSAPAQDAAR